MKKIRKAKTIIGMDDYIKAVRKADREAEMQLLGPGFHSANRIHRSKKSYSRKEKHRGQQSLDASFFMRGRGIDYGIPSPQILSSGRRVLSFISRNARGDIPVSCRNWLVR